MVLRLRRSSSSFSRYWPVWVMAYAIFVLFPFLRSSLECSTRNIIDDADFMAPQPKKRTKGPHLRKENSANPTVFELAMPFCGQSNKLFEFSERLGHSLSTLQSDVQMKLLVTKCIDDDHLSTDRFVEFLEDLAGGIPIETVPLDIKGAEFSRGLALNALTENACNDPGCYFAVVDVDMDVKPSFIENTISFVTSTTTMYYPIVFSEYEPSSVIAAETIFGELEPYHSQRGKWRKSGWGMYAGFGETVHSLKVKKRLDSKWGGEDGELKQQAESSGITIVREQERGLIHRWHPKLCTSEFVDSSFLRRCYGARDKYAGSPFIQQIRANEQAFFDYLVFLPAGPSRSIMAGSEWAAKAFMEFRKEQKDFGTKVPTVGDLVSYWFDCEYGYQLASVIGQEGVEENFKLTLEFLIDEEEKTVPYEAIRFNTQDTSLSENCRLKQ